MNGLFELFDEVRNVGVRLKVVTECDGNRIVGEVYSVSADFNACFRFKGDSEEVAPPLVSKFRRRSSRAGRM